MRYQTTGIPPEDLEPPYAKIIPDRVQKLTDLYRRNYIVYPWNQEDKNEQIFEYRRSLNPSSYRYTIEAIYRVRDPANKEKEYYFYQKHGKVLNDRDEVEYSNSLTYGYEIEPIHELKYNPKVKKKEPMKVRNDPVYFFEWNKKEVQKLLEKSEIPCTNLYIGIGYSAGQGSLGSITDVHSVKYLPDYLEGCFDDLLLLSKSGMVSNEASTLHLVEKAKSKLEEKALERVANTAVLSNPNQQQQQERLL
jgi:hypothetical protein